jgi:epsilon-lactone hydrolase
MSLRLRILMWVMRWFIKPRLGHIETPQAAREDFERTARRLFRIPPNTLFLQESFPGETGPRPALWISCGPSAVRRVILYFHGGGYVAGSPQTHRAMLARLSRLTGMRVFAPDYRLAPEHRYPAALNDAIAAFEALLAKGYAPGDIVIGGDSAGGGLALALLAKLCQAGRAPGAVFAFSPWCDLTLSGASLQDNRVSDVILLTSRVKEMRDYYAGGNDPATPGLSPLMATFPDCPAVLIQYSATEILADDSARMAARLRAQGGEVSLQTWPDAPHVWQVFDGWVPEARQALQATADFIAQARAQQRFPDEN